MKRLCLLFCMSTLGAQETYLQVSGLYWQPSMVGLEYARTEEGYQTPKACFDFGAKVGIGHTSYSSEWKLDATWTHFATKAKGTCAYYSNIAAVSSSASFDQIQSISSVWNMDLHLLDGTFGHCFWKYDQLELQPHLGIRFAQMKQNFTTTHIASPATIQVKQTNHFRGIGLLGGINPIWHFRDRVALYGKFENSILYGGIGLRKKEIGDHASYSYRDARLFVDLAIGLRHFALNQMLKSTFGLDYLVMVDQKRYWKTKRSLMETSKGTLSLKGLHFTVEFDF